MAFYDQKSHFTCHFDHLDIRNVTVLLTMPSASYDAEVGAHGVSHDKIGHVVINLIQCSKTEYIFVK